MWVEISVMSGERGIPIVVGNTYIGETNAPRTLPVGRFYDLAHIRAKYLVRLGRSNGQFLGHAAVGSQGTIFSVSLFLLPKEGKTQETLWSYVYLT